MPGKTASAEMALDRFRAAPLPNPPLEYDPQYVRQLIRVIETYFSQLDSNTPNHAQQYTASAFVGGSFTGTAIEVTSVNTTDITSNTAEFGYADADGISARAAIINGIRNDRIISTDMSATNSYADEFFGNGQHISVPYNQLQSTVSQTAASIAVAYALTMNLNDYPDGISIVSSSRITVAHAGVYEFTFSIQLQSTSTTTELVDIWFRKNGTDIAASNSRFSIAARKSAGIPSSLIAVTPFMVPLAANDYIEIMWRVSDVTVSIAAFPAVTASPGVTPAIPATPSAIVAIKFVSAPYPPTTYVAPLPVFGFGAIGNVTVTTSR